MASTEMNTLPSDVPAIDLEAFAAEVTALAAKAKV